MAPNSDLKNKLVKIQEKEITEYTIYKKVSERTTGNNSKILKQISQDELRHYNEWKRYTQTEVHPNKLSVFKYLIISKIFGLMFMMKLLEGNEEKAQKNYSKISQEFPEAKQILTDEIKHEKLLIEMIDEKKAQLFKFNYIRS